MQIELGGDIRPRQRGVTEHGEELEFDSRKQGLGGEEAHPDLQDVLGCRCRAHRLSFHERFRLRGVRRGAGGAEILWHGGDCFADTAKRAEKLVELLLIDSGQHCGRGLDDLREQPIEYGGDAKGEMGQTLHAG